MLKVNKLTANQWGSHPCRFESYTFRHNNKISNNNIKFNIIIGDFVELRTYPLGISKDINPLVSKT